MQKIPGYPEEEGFYLDTAEIGKRTRQENRRLTWLAVKQNKVSYLMILPFMLFFLVFTIVPVVMSLPMGFTDFNMVQMQVAFILAVFLYPIHSCNAGVCTLYRPDQLYSLLFAGVADQ